MTPSEIELATSWLVAQCLNQPQEKILWRVKIRWLSKGVYDQGYYVEEAAECIIAKTQFGSGWILKINFVLTVLRIENEEQ